MQIQIPKQNFNDIYLPYLYTHIPLQIYYGGAGSGKSYFIAQKIVVNLIHTSGFNAMVVRAINADNHDTTFAQIQQIINDWDLERLFKINKSLGKQEIECVTGNKVIFKGLDNVEKRKGTTFKTGPLTCIWIEEASEVKEADFNQLDLRLRGRTKIPKSIIISFNPIDIDHWIKSRFFDNKQNPEDCLIVKSTFLHNKFLDEEDKKRILKYKDIDEYYYQVYALGNWGSISTARVFHNLEIHDFSFDEDDLGNINHGMDFGYVHANTLMSSGQRENDLYIFSEYYYKGLTNPQFKDKINESGFDKRNVITADSAYPAYIAEFKEDGYLYIQGAKKKVKKKGDSGKGKYREMAVGYLKSFDKIHIHKTNCPNTAREFQIFKYRELRDGTVTPEFVKENDDTIDGVIYGTEHEWINRSDQQRPPDIGKNSLFGKTAKIKNGVASNKFIKNHEG